MDIALLLTVFIVGIAKVNSKELASSIGSLTTTTTTSEPITDENLAKAFLATLDMETDERCHNRTLAEWILASDITPENRVEAIKSSLEYSKFLKQKWKESQQYGWSGYHDPFIKRQFKLLSTLGMSSLPEAKLKKQTLESIFSKARICKPSDKRKCDLGLEPEVTELMMYSRNETELKSLWTQWRSATGKKMRKDYTEFASIMKEVALTNNFPEVSSYETRFYESPNFLNDLEKLWDQLQPFYLQLHGYIRRKLGEKYGTNIVGSTEPIPSHLFGNMWAQSWGNIFELVTPFNETKSIDATPFLVKFQFTPRKMAQVAENFFVSMGFPNLPQEFWDGSILEKLKDKDMVCHASSWDLCDKKNFWIKQCTRINMEDLITLHHEMGHTVYQIQYKNLPKLFRDGANPGFHEAIGDLISLSVQTPQHLTKVGLLEDVEESFEADINYLLLMALEKIAFLPFGLLVDKWRWGVFDGKIAPAHYNCEWWKLRVKYQGVSPPETRTEDDFDPGAKYHVAVNYGYTRYFVSSIIEFQFHQALCKIAAEFDPLNPDSKPLHKCDIYGSKDAGRTLMRMLRLGSSKPWPEAMESLTGQKKMDAGPILDYFRPLIEWLTFDNMKNNVTIGWKEKKPACRQSQNKAGIFNSSLLILIFTIVASLPGNGIGLWFKIF